MELCAYAGGERRTLQGDSGLNKQTGCRSDAGDGGWVGVLVVCGKLW